MTAPALVELLVALAGDLDGVEVRAGEGVHEVVAGDTLVAVLAAEAVELRLRPEVAAAALRTPDVAASRRGSGWVRFTPAELDGFARDRAAAWLESAVRFAVESESPD